MLVVVQLNGAEPGSRTISIVPKVVGWGEVVVVAWEDETEVTTSRGGTAALVEMVGATLVGICDAGAGCVVATVNGTVGSAHRLWRWPYTRLRCQVMSVARWAT